MLKVTENDLRWMRHIDEMQITDPADACSKIAGLNTLPRLMRHGLATFSRDKGHYVLTEYGRSRLQGTIDYQI
jgi:hypothetical protein